LAASKYPGSRSGDGARFALPLLKPLFRPSRQTFLGQGLQQLPLSHAAGLVAIFASFPLWAEFKNKILQRCILCIAPVWSHCSDGITNRLGESLSIADRLVLEDLNQVFRRVRSRRGGGLRKRLEDNEMRGLPVGGAQDRQMSAKFLWVLES
jgi:hypothetical protein